MKLKFLILKKDYSGNFVPSVDFVSTDPVVESGWGGGCPTFGLGSFFDPLSPSSSSELLEGFLLTCSWSSSWEEIFSSSSSSLALLEFSASVFCSAIGSPSDVDAAKNVKNIVSKY